MTLVAMSNVGVVPGVKIDSQSSVKKDDMIAVDVVVLNRRGVDCRDVKSQVAPDDLGVWLRFELLLEMRENIFRWEKNSYVQTIVRDVVAMLCVATVEQDCQCTGARRQRGETSFKEIW